MRIDVATIDALDAVVRLVGLQFAEHGIDGTGLPEALRGLLIEPNRGVVLIASAPEPIGVAVLAYTWTIEHGGPVAWLDELFVLPEHRNRGVGLALLRRALTVAREVGCLAVDLEVDAEHRRAERLYEREGFRRLSRSRWAKRL